MPTYLVSALTRRHVTVSLSGDGGDELFGGYNRYFLGSRIWNGVSRIPLPARRVMAAALAAPSVGRLAGAAVGLVPRYRQLNLPDRLPKVAQILTEATPQSFYRRLTSHFTEPGDIVKGGSEPAATLFDTSPSFSDFRQTMMYVDTISYLPDDILVKVDRAGMAVSLEGRIPFLDHRVVEFAWRVPVSAKIRGGKGKQILRQGPVQACTRIPGRAPEDGFRRPDR